MSDPAPQTTVPLVVSGVGACTPPPETPDTPKESK